MHAQSKIHKNILPPYNNPFCCEVATEIEETKKRRQEKKKKGKKEKEAKGLLYS